MLLREVRGALARFPELSVTAAGRIYVDVVLGARSHRVRVLPADDWLRVEGLIVPMGNVVSVPTIRDVAALVLRTNATSEFVGLAKDDDDRFVARYDVPPEADVEELVDAILRVARVADRWELLWTGEDGE